MVARTPNDIATQDIPFKQIICEMRHCQHPSDDHREILGRLEQRIEHEGDGFLRRLLILKQAHSGVVLTRDVVEAFIIADILVSKAIADLTDQSAAENQRWIERRRRLIEFEFSKMAQDALSSAKSESEESQAFKWIAEMATMASRLPPLSQEVSPGMRSDRNGSRALRIFVQRLSAAIRQVTGRWCDEEVATLAQIVFKRPHIDADNIRKLRAPTTRSARQGGALAAVPQEIPDL
jgi:hypothetical protein